MSFSFCFFGQTELVAQEVLTFSAENFNKNYTVCQEPEEVLTKNP